MNTYIGAALILSAAFCWGMIGVLARFLLESGMAPAELAFWRTTIGCLLFGAAAVVTKQPRLRAGKDISGFMIFGVGCLAANFFCYMASVREGGVALSIILQYTAPAWVVIFARVLFSEPLTKPKCLAVMVSLAGVAVVSFSGSSGSANITLLSVSLGLFTGFLFAIQTVGIKKLVTAYPPVTIFAYSFFFASLTLFPFVDFVEKSLMDWGILFALGAGCTFLPFFLYAAGIRRIEASTASIISTFEPVVATLAAWLVWNESFSASGMLGVALVLGAVFILVLTTRPSKTP